MEIYVCFILLTFYCIFTLLADHIVAATCYASSYSMSESLLVWVFV